MSQILDLRLRKKIFRHLKNKLIVKEYLECHVQVMQMIFKGATVNEYVIEENNDEAAEKWLENQIHHRLKRGWSIAEPKGHDSELIVSVVSSKSSLRDICRMHSYLMVSLQKVKFRKALCSSQFIKQFINCWNWEAVLDRK